MIQVSKSLDDDEFLPPPPLFLVFFICSIFRSWLYEYFGANILKIGWKLWLLWFFTFFFLRYFEIINKFQHDSPLKCYSNGPYKTKFIKIPFDPFLSINLDKLDVFRLGRPYILYTEYMKLFNNVYPGLRFWLLQGSSQKHPEIA